MVCVNHPSIFLKSARVELVVGHVLARARLRGEAAAPAEE